MKGALSGVVRTPEGRFRAWVPLGVEGKKKWLKGSWETAEAAFDARRDALKDRETIGAKKVVTLKRAIQAIEADYKANGQEGTLRWFGDQAKAIIEFFGEGREITEIQARKLREFRDAELRRGLSASSVQHRKRALSIICNEMCRRGHLSKNPVTEVKWPKADQKPFEWIPGKELKVLLAKIPPPDRGVIELAFQTGMRRAELTRLAKDHVNGDYLTIMGKTGVERQRINKRAQAILEDFPFGLSVHQVATIFKRWQKKLNEPRLHPHAMRHSYAMALREAGHDIYEVCRLMRHRSIEQTKVYFHDEGLSLGEDLLG